MRGAHLNRIAGSRLLVFVAMIFVFSTIGLQANAAPDVTWSRSASGASQSSASSPVAFGSEGTAGPWRITVLEVVLGDDATTLVSDASTFNEPPADGLTYVVVRLRVVNTAGQPFRVDFNDFGVVTENGIVRRFVGVTPPAPALDLLLAAGEEGEGWVVAGAPSDAQNLILLYDSASISGSWADATFALSDGAQIAGTDSRAIELNKTGRDPANPAGIGTQVVTREWAVELIDVAQGGAVVDLYPASDYRTTALLGGDLASPVSQTWIAFKIRVTNNRAGSEPAYFPLTAILLAEGNGDPVTDAQTLSAPNPEAAGWYLPGATREGWVVLDLLTGSGRVYDGALLRFLPYGIDEDARYIAWDGSGATIPEEPSFTGTLTEGTVVRVTEDQVRMRAEPSTDSDIVDELSAGTELVVTGAPQDGDELTWYPVENEETGDSGFVAQQLIEPVE